MGFISFLIETGSLCSSFTAESGLFTLSVFLMCGHSHAFSSNGSFTLLVSHSHRTAGHGCGVQYGVEVEVCGGGGDALSDVSAIQDLQAHSGDSLFSVLITPAYSHVGCSLQGGVCVWGGLPWRWAEVVLGPL